MKFKIISTIIKFFEHKINLFLISENFLCLKKDSTEINIVYRGLFTCTYKVFVMKAEIKIYFKKIQKI